jgi:predicted Rossmann fold nucleotide-binding protein DprA/Smf involved in DNA uptake
MILYVDAGAISGTALGVDAVVVLAAAAVTVAVAPFLLLLAYVLRIATVTKRTLSIGPFILRETDADEVEWD